MVDTIPASLDEVTPAWLTDVIRTSPGASDDVTITDRTMRVVGTGAGFTGEIAVVGPRYQAGSGPSSLVVKIPTSIEENRQGAELGGVYERELHVYEELLTELDVPVPVLFHGAIEPTDVDAQRQLDLFLRAERLPVWILRLLGRLVRRFAKPSSRRSVMVLEDLAPATVGDQVAGCRPDEAARVLRVAAGLHASTWGDRRPATSTWLQSAGIVPKIFHAGFLDARKGFLRRADGLIGDHTRALVQQVRRDGRHRISRMHESIPNCLLHGDLRLDNMFFDADGEVRALIDWQIANLGPAIIDVAYFISGSVTADIPETDIDTLLAQYHAALVGHGVADYPIERLVADYEEALLLILHRMAGLDTLDFGEDRGVALIDVWIRRLDARLARVPAP